MALLCNKNHSSWRFFGQYTDNNQPNIDWQSIAKDLCLTNYNGYVRHLMSPFNGNDFPWLRLPHQVGIFDLDKLNPNWFFEFEEMCIQLGGRGNNILSICFFDSYITRFNNKPHPFKHNNKNINWGDGNERALYNPYKGGNPNLDSSYTWLSYRTDAHDNVISFKFKEKFMEDYIVGVIKVLERVKKMFPNRFKVVFRVHNENDESIGGDTRVHEIFEKLFTEHAPSFKIGRDLWQADDYVEMITVDGKRQPDLRQLLRGNIYLKSKRRLQEVHNVDSNLYTKIRGYRTEIGGVEKQFDTNIMIMSTDGMKPENDTFVPRCRALLAKNPAKIDFKVPSQLSHVNPIDYNKTFKNVLPIMKDITE